MQTDAPTTMNLTITPKTIDPQPPTWLTVNQMAERVQVHPKTLLRLAGSGRIPCLRAGKAIRFDPAAVERCLMQG